MSRHAAIAKHCGSVVFCKETHKTVIRFAPPLVITKEQVDWAVWIHRSGAHISVVNMALGRTHCTIFVVNWSDDCPASCIVVY